MTIASLAENSHSNLNFLSDKNRL